MRRLPPSLAAMILVGAAPMPAPTEPPPAAIRVDQIGFETDGPKIAILATGSTTPVAWTLSDATGRVVARGHGTPFGADAASGEAVQRIDFGNVRVSGDGFRLAAGDARSHDFSIGPRPYAALATDAMGFFYQQRSGVAILPQYVQRPDLARKAGHPRDIATCFDGTDQRGVRWQPCDYSLDATGGWYDAGDHGKYVVNGGIATWTLLDLDERLAALGDAGAFADGRLPIPERGNGRDDLLDEARVEVNFLIAMQIPEGRRVTVAMKADQGGPASDFQTIDGGGLAHTKIADERWTGLPMAPADDPMRRFLYPPSTAATLNLAAVTAQAARLWRTSDPAFAAKALASATRAWDAANRHPAIPTNSDFTGSGGYGDKQVSDEFFWAAAQLFVTTGEKRYADAIAASPFLAHPETGLSWGSTDLAGLLTLATVPNRLPPATVASIRARVVAIADGFLAERARSGYLLPTDSVKFGWGSNSTMLNRAIVLGVAWQITRQPRYRDAVVDVVDYLLGRNALDRSYVTGYGVRTMHQPHHRFWAKAADPRFPAPPPGVLSGGPNSGSSEKDNCVGQTCWRDDWRAFTLNEVAINWNAPLVWAAGFLDASRSKSAPRSGPAPR